MIVNRRLRAIRTALNVSQKLFAKGIFISTSYYAGIETGHRQVNDRIIDLVSTQYHVNKNWILTGQGEMFGSLPPDVRIQELIDIFSKLNPHFQAYILDQTRDLEKIQFKEQNPDKKAK
jgi:transcriptional regulator with XRE-family HTH domain